MEISDMKFLFPSEKEQVAEMLEMTGGHVTEVTDFDGKILFESEDSFNNVHRRRY